jgi:hypothetical protein
MLVPDDGIKVGVFDAILVCAEKPVYIFQGKTVVGKNFSGPFR